MNITKLELLKQGNVVKVTNKRKLKFVNELKEALKEEGLVSGIDYTILILTKETYFVPLREDE